MSRVTRKEIVDRLAQIHETWFMEEAAPPGGGRMYRLLEKQRGKPVSEWTTGPGLWMFMDGYEHGRKSLEEERRKEERW